MFDVDKNRQILFYGFSQFDMVRNKYRDMLECGYHVLGYIDKNAENIRKYEKVPCWNIESLPFEKDKRREMIIVILLQNGQIHEEVALHLEKEGFFNILFLPASLETKEQKHMCTVYNFFLEGDYGQLKNISEVQFIVKRILSRRQIIQSSKNSKIVFVPTEILFMYQENIDEPRCNVRYDKKYHELYDFLAGKREGCNSYLQFMGVEGEEEQKCLLNDRKKLYLKFECENNLETDFFVRSAANVKWNKNGYFNIVDGHHRVEFLVYREYRCIPVRMSEEDFELWKNKKQLKECIEIENIRCPIPNPSFLNSSILYLQIWRNVTDYMYYNIFSRDKDVIHMLEIDSYDGYFARVCQLLGWTLSYIGVQSEEQLQICRQLNKLLYQDNIKVVNYREEYCNDIQLMYIDSREIDVKQFEKLVCNGTCKQIIVEINLLEKENYMKILERKFGKRAQLIYWCNSDTGVYGIGEEKWQK